MCLNILFQSKPVQIESILQGEVLQLRHQWTAESVERQRLAAEIIEMRLDLNQSIENHQRCLKDLSQLTTEVNYEPFSCPLKFFLLLFFSVGGN